MIHWEDEGMLLSLRRHGEGQAIVEVFTAAHGRHLGVVRGGAGRRMAPVLQPGARLQLAWRARLDEHLGAFTVEPLQTRAGLFGDRRALAALNAVVALLAYALPERLEQAEFYRGTVALLDRIEADPGWEADYARWELALLEGAGFGLDLSVCAVTGVTEELAYVSPRTGRAVSASAAGAWADRLLPLPPLLLGGAGDTAETLRALETTGHFLRRSLAPERGGRPLPAARQRFIEILSH